MLAYILALAVGLGSLGVYLAAFFLPEVHRKSDFYWSGIGLFYALMLWVCAGRITGGVLVGQIAGVALLGWFGWQTLTLRRELTPVAQQTDLPSKEEAAETIRVQAESLKDNVQSKLSKVSLPAGISDLPQKLADLFANAKTQVVARLDAAKKPKVKPTPATPKSATPVGATKEAAPPIPTTETVKIYPEVKPKESFTFVENIAPGVELSPPTKPLGLDDPADRNSLVVDIITTVEVIPTPEVTSNAAEVSASESSKEGDIFGLKRPNPPDPELLKEVVEDAPAKNQPSSPPDKVG